MVRTLLIEIGTEEIPAGYLRTAVSSFADGFNSLLDSKRVARSNTRTFFTPRRLAIIIDDVALSQEKTIKKIKGPPADIAYKDGKPTSAAKGFASGKGVPLDSLKIEEFKGKRFIVAEVEEEIASTITILKDNLLEVVKNIKFPKKMRWEETNFLFARPIRWIVALFGDELIEFSIAGVKSGRISMGHRLISPGEIEIEPSNYVENLKNSYVVVDYDEREKKLREMILKKAGEVGGEPVIPEYLLEEVTNLIEYPFVIKGSFDEKFLRLPEQVILTAMESHQRYFPVKKDGNLLPYFISAVNNVPNKDIISGNEKVLEARLEDARFYWETDKKISITDRVSILDGIIWHKSLGTLLDRTHRLVKLSEWIGERVPDVNNEVIKEGARLSKADLTTLMIRDGKEFTNLEGHIGAEYAREEGMEEVICRVIEEHYRPRNAEDGLPGTKEAAVVSLADRIDLIIGSFLAGDIPTGSRDPLGLRQAFNGFIRIVVDFKFDVSMEELVEKGTEEFYIDNIPNRKEEIVQFIKDRIESYLQSIGIRYDIANAVLSRGWDNLLTATMIANAMMEFRKDEDEFEHLVIGQKRVSNILEGKKMELMTESLLKEEQEKRLYLEAKNIESELKKYIGKKRYLDALNLLKGLRPFIDSLFDNVLVMTDEEELRHNRLALLYYVRGLFHLVADFEEIVID
ncbi:glycine--tRNA ligase subunit beta [candidate division WOR-3 bacterium]|nr:glycine--tRNA ligase subunit beta [candidate division WOR-3 bacterium]